MNMFETNRLYTNMQSLKDDFVKVFNLDLNYFEKLFIYLFVCYLLESLLSFRPVLKVFFRFVLKKMKLFKMIIQEYQIRLQLRLTFKLPVCKLS